MGPPGPAGPPGAAGAAGATGATGPAGPVAVTPFFGTALADLGATWRKSGTVLIEPPGGFTSSQVGKPVLIQQAPSGTDADELQQVRAVAEILTTRRMRVRWMCETWAHGQRKFNYLIAI